MVWFVFSKLCVYPLSKYHNWLIFQLKNNIWQSLFYSYHVWTRRNNLKKMWIHSIPSSPPFQMSPVRLPLQTRPKTPSWASNWRQSATACLIQPKRPVLARNKVLLLPYSEKDRRQSPTSVLPRFPSNRWRLIYSNRETRWFTTLTSPLATKDRPTTIFWTWGRDNTWYTRTTSSNTRNWRLEIRVPYLITRYFLPKCKIKYLITFRDYIPEI